jgi:hypothetical protein
MDVCFKIRKYARDLPDSFTKLKRIFFTAAHLGHWSLVTGHWSLVTGHWSLVTGHWSLVTGHWSMGTGIGHWGEDAAPSWQARAEKDPGLADAVRIRDWPEAGVAIGIELDRANVPPSIALPEV